MTEGDDILMKEFSAQDPLDGRAIRRLTETIPEFPEPYGWSWELTWDPEDIPSSPYIVFVYNALDDDPVASGYGETAGEAAGHALTSLRKWLKKNPDFDDLPEPKSFVAANGNTILTPGVKEDDPSVDHTVDEENGGYRAG
jgi:hypothetical protein